jgi:hypothetical protein
MFCLPFSVYRVLEHGRSAGLIATRIADEGFNHSQVAETAAYLADQIGGRMTNSPSMRRAERWSQDKFKAWGLKNVHTEGFDFGRGWWIESSYVRMVAPRPAGVARHSDRLDSGNGGRGERTHHRGADEQRTRISRSGKASCRERSCW